MIESGGILRKCTTLILYIQRLILSFSFVIQCEREKASFKEAKARAAKENNLVDYYQTNAITDFNCFSKELNEEEEVEEKQTHTYNGLWLSIFFCASQSPSIHLCLSHATHSHKQYKLTNCSFATDLPLQNIYAFAFKFKCLCFALFLSSFSLLRQYI